MRTPRPGDVPLVVATVDGGAQWRQISLPAPGGLGVITALTATPGRLRRSRPSGQRQIRSTPSPGPPKDGLTWSQPTQTADSKITALTAPVGTEVYGTAERGATPAVITVPAP